MPSRSPVDLHEAPELGAWHQQLQQQSASLTLFSRGGSSLLRSSFCSVAQAQDVPQRRSPQPSVVDIATRHALKPPTPTQQLSYSQTALPIPAAGPFSMVGSTMRGRSVAITNQGGLNRVCSDGSVAVNTVAMVEVGDGGGWQSVARAPTPAAVGHSIPLQQQLESVRQVEAGVQHSASFLAFRPQVPTPTNATPVAAFPQRLIRPASPGVRLSPIGHRPGRTPEVSLSHFPSVVAAGAHSSPQQQQTPKKSISPAPAALVACEPFGATSSAGASSRRSIESSCAGSSASGSSSARTAKAAACEEELSVVPQRSLSPVPYAGAVSAHSLMSGAPDVNGSVRLALSSSIPDAFAASGDASAGGSFKGVVRRQKKQQAQLRHASDPQPMDATPECTLQCNACAVM